MLGALSLRQAWLHNARLGGLSGIFVVGMGVRYLVKYRKPDVRAKHVEYWTAKA